MSLLSTQSPNDVYEDTTEDNDLLAELIGQNDSATIIETQGDESASLLTATRTTQETMVSAGWLNMWIAR